MIMETDNPALLLVEEQAEPRAMDSINLLPPRIVDDPSTTTDSELMNKSQLGRSHSFEPAVDVTDTRALKYAEGFLKALSELYRNHPSMESLLQLASQLTVDIMNFEHCSIGWLNDSDIGIEVWTSYTRANAEVDRRRVDRVFSGLVKRLAPKHNNVFKDLLDTREEVFDLIQEQEIVSPLRVDDQIVGYTCGLKSECSDERVSDIEKSVFFAFSGHISAAIEAQRTREILNNPYIALALTPKERELVAGLTSLEQPFSELEFDPELLVRKIARCLCTDLQKAGFEVKQMLCVATEILDSLLILQRGSKLPSS